VIDRYARGSLETTERVEMDAHIAECARCRSHILALDGTQQDDPRMTPTLAATSGTAPSAPGNAPTLPSGAMLGRYRIERVIGAGGMGVVYRAFDPKLGRAIALKVVRTVDGSASDAHTRLIREARAMAKISHPNVIAVHDTGDVDDEVFIAMELVVGSNLADWEKARPHPWRDLVGVYLQAARGLAAAHSVGLVHRDFKPHNVLVGDDERVRVLDFGIARSLDETDAPRTSRAAISRASQMAITETGAILGSPLYMSPEQHAGERADARSDQFSFCVALYHALYGVLPFPGTTYFELRHAVTTSEAAPPPRSSPIPPTIGHALLRGLSRERGARFSSMDELITLLADAARPRSHRWLLGASTALVVALVATVIVLATRTPVAPMEPELGFEAHQQPATFVDSDAPTLSPDGHRLAYSSAAGVVVRDLATGNSKIVYKGGANDLRWSPVGDRLLIATRTGPRIITADGVLVRELNLFGTLCRNAWSPDATRVVWHCFTDETFTVIHVASGETRTVVLSMPGLEKVTDLDWSFRGELAVAGLTKLGGEVWVADIDKVTAERLAVENKVVVAVRWNARGTRVYYSRLKPSGGGEIVHRDRGLPGIAQVALPVPSLSLSSQASFAITADERALFYSLQGDHADIVKRSATSTAPSFITTDAQLKVALSLSPDGGELAYAAGSVSAQQVYRQRLGGGSPISLPLPVGSYIRSCYSPRGDRLAILGRHGIAIVTLASGKVQNLPSPRMLRDELAWTSAGLVFQAETGALVVVDPVTGQSVTRDLGLTKITLTAFSRDGSRAAGLDASRHLVMVDLRDGSSRVISNAAQLRPLDFSEDGTWIYASQPSGGNDERVVAVSVGDGAQRLLGVGSKASESRVLPGESVVQIVAQARQVIWLASRDVRPTLVPESMAP
jgi:Tol biopolymer transport system component/predicted Ser/Thr protein kinase